MRAKKEAKNQLSFLAPSLKEQLNADHELYLLSHAMDWEYFETEFAPLYSNKGRPAHSPSIVLPPSISVNCAWPGGWAVSGSSTAMLANDKKAAIRKTDR